MEENPPQEPDPQQGERAGTALMIIMLGAHEHESPAHTRLKP